ncbi:MAG: diguanylate cyclase [Burkholderiales bacterium]|nr:diguanylate cyclase [Burkholderiales bacterium]
MPRAAVFSAMGMKPGSRSNSFDLRTMFARREFTWAATAFGIGLALTLCVWAWTQADHRADHRAASAERAHEFTDVMHSRLGDFEALLHGAAALFAATSGVERNEWRSYVQALQIDKRYPGIAALGYAEHVPGASKSRHEGRARKQGLPSYAITPPGQRDAYAPVVFVEPFTPNNARTAGFDLLTDPARRQALLKARDSADIVISGKVLLVPENGQRAQSGVQMVLPIYRRNFSAATLEQRRAALSGYVYAMVRFDDMVEAAAAKESSAIQIGIYEGGEISDASRLYQSSPHDPSPHDPSYDPLVETISKLDVAGRIWTLHFSSTPQFEAGVAGSKSHLVLISGLVISALLAALVWLAVAKQPRFVERFVEHRLFAALFRFRHRNRRNFRNQRIDGSRHAQPQSARWKAIFDRADWGMAMISDDRLQAVNASYAEMHGYTISELLGQAKSLVVAPEAVVELDARDRVGQGKGSHTFQSVHVRKDGTRFPVLVDIATVKGDDGETLYQAANVQDISERKLIEQRLVESTQSLKLVMESARIGIWELDFESGDVLNSVVLYRIFGYGDGLPDWNYDLFLQHVQADDREAVNAGFERAMKGAATWDFECRIARADRSEGWIWGRGSLKRNSAGEAVRLVILIGDISERRQAEDEVRRLNAELEQRVAERTAQFEAANRQIERDYSNILLLSDMSGLLQSCSTSTEAFDVIRRYCAKLFAGQAGALYLMHDSRKYLSREVSWGDDTFDLLSADQCWALRRGEVHQAQDAATDQICEHVRALHAPPDAPPPYLCIPMTAHNEILGLFHVEFARAAGAGPLAPVDRQFIITLSEQISLALANLRLRESLREQSIRDPLTGLFNRRYMQEAFRQQISRAERKGINLAIVMIDVDHFKRLNDQFGHDAGDVVLKQIGELLQSQIRGADIACRFGGEEFVLLLYESPLEAVRRRAERIRCAVRSLQLVHENRPLGTLTISLGIAAFPEHGASVETLLVAADRALYAAKHGGRDRVAVSGAREPPER